MKIRSFASIETVMRMEVLDLCGTMRKAKLLRIKIRPARKNTLRKKRMEDLSCS